MALVRAMVKSQTVFAQAKPKVKKVALRTGHFRIHSGCAFQSC